MKYKLYLVKDKTINDWKNDEVYTIDDLVLIDETDTFDDFADFLALNGLMVSNIEENNNGNIEIELLADDELYILEVLKGGEI